MSIFPWMLLLSPPHSTLRSRFLAYHLLNPVNPFDSVNPYHAVSRISLNIGGSIIIPPLFEYIYQSQFPYNLPIYHQSLNSSNQHQATLSTLQHAII